MGSFNSREQKPDKSDVIDDSGVFSGVRPMDYHGDDTKIELAEFEVENVYPKTILRTYQTPVADDDTETMDINTDEQLEATATVQKYVKAYLARKALGNQIRNIEQTVDYDYSLPTTTDMPATTFGQQPEVNTRRPRGSSDSSLEALWSESAPRGSLIISNEVMKQQMKNLTESFRNSESQRRKSESLKIDTQSATKKTVKGGKVPRKTLYKKTVSFVD